MDKPCPFWWRSTSIFDKYIIATKGLPVQRKWTEHKGHDDKGYTRACLKIAFCKMCFTLCGRFGSNLGGVAGYID